MTNPQILDEQRMRDCEYCGGGHVESDCPDNPSKTAPSSKPSQEDKHFYNGDCPRCGETNIHNKEVVWECQDCNYIWPKEPSQEEPSQEELETVLPAILKRSADKGYVQKQDVEKALSAINSLTLKQVLALIDFQLKHEPSTLARESLKELRQSAERIWGKQ